MPPLFVAEISSNHNQDIDRCLRSWTWPPRSAAAPSSSSCSPCRSVRRRSWRKRGTGQGAYELPCRFFLPAIAGRCRQRGVLFGCTPFSLAAVEQLAGQVDFLKIASYELLWPPLGAACAATGLPVMLATGLADLAEVAGAVENLRRAGCPEPTLLHCVSAYPLPPGEANLAAIDSLRRAFGLPVGWSDHSRCPGVIHRAVHRFGAEVVELHLDLEGEGREYGAGHCWLPGELAECIRDVAVGLAADGDGVKACAPCEAPDRDWRADPHDGLRPLRRVRAGFTGDNGGAS